MSLHRKDMLGLRDVSADEINEILLTAQTMKGHLGEKTNYIKGKSVITLFYENSTRTRMSFELAAKNMGGTSSSVSASTSSVAKGETLIDTGRTLDVMGADVIVIRHPMAGAPHLLSKNVKACVINAGDGMNEHPTQALLDMFTIMEQKGHIEGLKVAIVGDIAHSRVARSNIWGLTTMGAQVTLASPSTLIPCDIEKTGVTIAKSVEDALADADVVMGLRIQLERQQKGLFPSVREYTRFYGLNEERIALSKDDALIMHPGPMNRGVEIASEVADSHRSVITKQVTNGIAVRMALLYLLTKRGEIA